MEPLKCQIGELTTIECGNEACKHVRVTIHLDSLTTIDLHVCEKHFEELQKIAEKERRQDGGR